MKKIRLAIIDDHVVVRMGLKFAIRLAADFEFSDEWGGCRRRMYLIDYSHKNNSLKNNLSEELS